MLVELQALPQPEMAERLAKVAQQVERFEFDAALAALLKRRKSNVAPIS